MCVPVGNDAGQLPSRAANVRQSLVGREVELFRQGREGRLGYLLSRRQASSTRPSASSSATQAGSSGMLVTPVTV